MRAEKIATGFRYVRVDQGPKDSTGRYWAVVLDGLTYKMVLDDLIAA